MNVESDTMILSVVIMRKRKSVLWQKMAKSPNRQKKGGFRTMRLSKKVIAVAMASMMIDSCICLYFSPQFHMLHTEHCSARRKTGCHHPWKLRFLWLCSHGLRYTGRPVYSSYSFHTSYLFSFLPCLVSTGGAVPVDAFSGVSAIRHSPPHHNPGCALHHILAPQCPNHIQ